jgi:serine/threonine protein kinase
MKDRASEEPLHPLAPGTRVGYGAVYRAERVGFRRSQPGALKVSLGWLNGRMEREVQLLSRLNHPSIPRLLDWGGRHPTKGGEHPFFVMEWVHGTPLYVWAEQHSLSGPPLCRVPTQLARALEAVHAQGAVHRDVGSKLHLRVHSIQLGWGSPSQCTHYGACVWQ